ncbi:MAG TPA: SpoIID/LytB domain-containing protein [Propionicimonas sp.]|uniref:SpoIID/LytB domain-containing protein n=1 Tax=Propionicimonas sp. TaxID=1955623 RepID=UPI002F422FD2
MFTVLTVLSLTVGSAPARAATGYTLTGVAAASGITTSTTAIRLTATFQKNGKAVKKATARLQYAKGGAWVTEKKVAIRAGKGSVKVKHGVGDRTYRFTIKGKATSAPFVVHFVPATFTVTGSGMGHGVGMSQYGAYQLAREGRSAAEILTTYYAGAAVGTAFNNPRTIKVQVLGPPADARSTTKLSITAGGFTIADGTTIVATTKAGTPVAIGVRSSRVTATVTLANGKTATLAATRLRFTWNTAKATVAVAGAHGRYRLGNLQVTVIGGRPNVVNELKMNTEYLYGIDEMPSSWGSAAGQGMEALKAQVIAARSYVITQALKWNPSAGGVNPACDCQVFDDPRSQNFTGWKKTGGAAGGTWRAAVDATVRAGTVDVVRPSASAVNQVAETPYFASSGSYSIGGLTYSGTVSNADAFNTAAVAYLSHVEDPYSVRAPGNPYRSWTVTVSQAKAEALFGIGKIRSLKVTERYAGGLVKLITATSTTGATSTLPPRTSEGWRIALGLPGAWVAGITGR